MHDFAATPCCLSRTLRPQKSEPGHCALMTAFCLLMNFILVEKE